MEKTEYKIWILSSISILLLVTGIATDDALIKPLFSILSIILSADVLQHFTNQN